jgi:hypothetical protein
MNNLDEYEQDILQSIESGVWESKNNTYELKKKALENSIPYQNLIQILIHQFATNKIKLSM